MVPFEDLFDDIIDAELPLKSADFARISANNEQDRQTLLRLSPTKCSIPSKDLGLYLEYLNVPFTYSVQDESFFGPLLTGNFFLPKNRKSYESFSSENERVRELIQHFITYGDCEESQSETFPLSDFSFLRFEKVLYEEVLDAFMVPLETAPKISKRNFLRLRSYLLEQTDSALFELLKLRWNV